MGTASFILCATILAFGVGQGGDHVLRPGSGETAPKARSDGAKASATPVASPSSYPLARPFVLSVGDTALVEGGLWLRFVLVAEDSRCPEDVVCVWEGNARVVVEAGTDDADTASLGLDTNPGFENEATYLTYRIGLVGLEPYPRSDVQELEPYRAILVVDTTALEPEASTSPSAIPSAAHRP